MSDTSTSKALRPTKKQKELLAYIEAFIAEHGYSPSYREIMNGLKYTSVATVALHVGNLIKRGHLRKRDHSARSLEVVSSAAAPGVAAPEVAPEAEPEQWLVGKVRDHFTAAEQADQLTQTQVDNLYLLLGALQVLELHDAAENFVERLASLKVAAEPANN